MMADDDLKTPVNVSALQIDAASIPRGYSPAYQRYILSQALDFRSVAGKANEAGQGAYDAQVKNDEQDVTLKNHGERITTAEEALANHEKRITTSEKVIANHEKRITDIKNDYVSKTKITEQTIASSLSVKDYLAVNGDKVVGPRQIGWTEATGTANKGQFDADLSFTVSDPPTQAEIQVIASALIEARQRIKAMEDSDRTHGLIN